ncbi:D-lactate dehydrogenase (cytochrome) [Pyrenophora seminiperda CCB06]|uniref:D-lactate dehydrogenase (cytochrome) n=1 Tax=Pyrenophora seminiperda CCB06 TaxID=1302712 RepID=A0A3M7MCY9_9PLEO|nr:D-lactate dehydrogenase (cytochrome) [Pyrenophora seminiperda CCB06]
MFRQPAARLRQTASLLLKRNGTRARTGAEQSVRPGHVQRPFWNSGRVLLFSAVTGTTTYFYGANEEPHRLQMPWLKSTGPQYASKYDMEKALVELRQVLGEDAISTDDEDLHRHGYSEWSTINIDQLPVAVAYPKSTEECAQIAKVCYKYKIPMSKATKYMMQQALTMCSSVFRRVKLGGQFFRSFAALTWIRSMDVVVQPSVPWMSLNDQIKDSGLFFPVDPGPSASKLQVNRGSGTNAVRYGTMKDWVINLTVVLADAGYNLTNLFIGSEGTLGIVTEITLKLAVVPQETSVAVVTFPTIRDAAAAASRILRKGVPVAAMEIMDEVQMGVINKAGSTSKKWEELPTMFFKFSGTKAGVQENIEMVKEIAKSHKSGDLEFAVNAEEQKTLWSARKESLWSMLALRREGDEVWSTDVAVPISRLPDIIEISKKEMDDLGLFASILGHIGDGNFHESIMYNSKDPKERAAVEKCVHDMVDRALEMEGTCTGEHGIGLGKKESLKKELGLETINVMRNIKGALDPYWLMNPGKIMDAQA